MCNFVCVSCNVLFTYIKSELGEEAGRRVMYVGGKGISQQNKNN